MHPAIELVSETSRLPECKRLLHALIPSLAHLLRQLQQLATGDACAKQRFAKSYNDQKSRWSGMPPPSLDPGIFTEDDAVLVLHNRLFDVVVKGVANLCWGAAAYKPRTLLTSAWPSITRGLNSRANAVLICYASPSISLVQALVCCATPLCPLLFKTHCKLLGTMRYRMWYRLSQKASWMSSFHSYV